MAFDLNKLNNVSSGAAAGVRVYSYETSDDILSDIMAPAYFGEASGAFSAGDVLYIRSTSGSNSYQVEGFVVVKSATVTTVSWRGSVGLMHAKTTIPSSAVRALKATAQIVVDQAPSGMINLFETAQLQVNYNSAAYVEPNNDENLTFKYTGPSGVVVSETVESTGFVTATADTSVRAVAAKNAIIANSAAEGTAIYLTNIGTGELTTGNSPIVVNTCFALLDAV